MHIEWVGPGYKYMNYNSTPSAIPQALASRPCTPLPIHCFDPLVGIAGHSVINTTSFTAINHAIPLPTYGLLPAHSVSSPISDTLPLAAPNSSPTPAPSTVKPCLEFTSKEFIGLATAVVNINSFGAKHGKKGVKWEEVVREVKSKGLFMKSSTNIIKHKMLALIKYQDVSCEFNVLVKFSFFLL
jgi:hypothetical protein